MLKNKARAQKVSVRDAGYVVGKIYRAAMDVSFRRSGGLFVILKSRKDVHKIARKGDAIGDAMRNDTDLQFDKIIQEYEKIQNMPLSIIADIASLDGAVVIERSGKFSAYAAVLSPKKKGRLSGTEGSRTKAAIGASNYGLALKISSDGDITAYHNGSEFIRV